MSFPSNLDRPRYLVQRGAPDNARWVAHVLYPAIMGDLSKNRMNVVAKRGSRGGIIKSSSYNRAKADLAEAVQEQLVQVKHRLLIPEDELMIREQKLWIAILLEKRQYNIDAANVVDIVCDAVQEATGLNDYWYSLGCVDWAISPIDPMMRLTLWQENKP